MASYAESLFSGKKQSPFGPAPEVGAGLSIGNGGVMTPQQQQQFATDVGNINPSPVVTPVASAPTDINAKLMANLSQSQPQEPQKNFLQNIVGGFTDLAATGYRAAQGVGRGIEAIGQSALGDKAAAAETMRKINEDIYKPVNIPLLGQGNVRRIGDVTESGAIAPSKETLKSLGTAADVGSFFMNPAAAAEGQIAKAALKTGGKELVETAAKALPSLAKQRFVQGAIQGGGSTLADTGDIGKATGSALLGGAFNVGLGKASDFVGNKLGKTVGKIEPKLAAQQKAVDDYASAIGIKKSFYTNEAKKAAGKSFKDPKEVLRTMVEDGIELKAKNEGGRNIFDTVGNIEALKSKTGALEDQLQSVIASRPQKTFNLNVLATKAKANIKALENVTAAEKNRMMSKIDDIIQAEKVANGFKQGDTKAMSRSAFVDGNKANQLKRGLYNMANFEKQTTGSDTHLKTLANVIKDSIETSYKGVEDVAALNKEYGRALEQIDFLTSLNGQVVQGGRIPKLAARAAGLAMGAAIPLPLPGIKEYAGQEIGGKLFDTMTDPTRLTKKAISAYKKAGQETPSITEPIKNAVSDGLSKLGLPPAKQKIIMDSLPELTDILMNAFNKTVINPVQPSPQSAQPLPDQISSQPSTEDPNVRLMQELERLKAAQ